MTHPSPRTLLDRYGFAAKKSWGQNFLADPHVPERIAAATRAGPGDTVVEIGAGLGHLTAALLERGARVIAVERDRDMVRVLRGELGGAPALTIEEANVSAFDFGAAAAAAGRPLVVAGNLPYHLSTQILVHLLDERRHLAAFVIMLQKEVADRIASPPGGREYGVLSVFAQAYCDVTRVLEVGPGAFLPPPKVKSTVLRFDVRAVPRAPIADDAAFRRVVHAAFGQRRKQLHNALAGGLHEAGAVVGAALVRAGIDPKARAETLGVAEFARLTDALLPALSVGRG